MVRVELEIPRRSPYVGVVRLALSSLARSVGLDEEVVDDLKIAVSEACANAVLAGEEAGRDGGIKVSWIEEEQGLIVEIDSEGLSGEPTDEQRFAMSMALLETLVDECEISQGRDGRVLTRLVLGR